MSKKRQAETAAAMAATSGSTKPAKASGKPVAAKTAAKAAKPAAKTPATVTAPKTIDPAAIADYDARDWERHERQAASATDTPYREIAVARIFPSPLNPRRRRREEDIPELGRSIAEKGLLQPILVRPAPDDRFEIILGARRHAAASWAVDNKLLPGDWAMPCRVRECSDSELVILAGVENFDREDMEPLDEAELFAQVRPHVTAAAGERVEAAIARLFHVSERNVFRRLALLKCAPEVRQALRDDKINLAQAQAFAIGTEEKQRAVLDTALPYAGQLGDYDADEIRDQVTDDPERRVLLSGAIFDLADYKAEIVEADTGEKYGTDLAEYNRLQAAAIEAKAEALREHWPWVEIRRGHYGNEFRTYNIAEGDPEAGALVHINEYTGAIGVTAPVRRIVEPIAASVTGTGAGAPDTEKGRPPLSNSQIAQLHEYKTQAIRRALTSSRDLQGLRLTLALSILGLAGGREIRGMAAVSYEPSYSRLQWTPSAQAEQDRLQHLLKTATLAMHPRDKIGGNGAGLSQDGYDSDNLAAWLEALLDLGADDLSELHALLLADRIGSWVIGPEFGGGVHRSAQAQLGDTPLAVAIAKASGAERYLPDLWQPGPDWFKQYNRDRLVAIVGEQLGIRNADKMKKAELVALCADQAKGFWRPEHFPECRFQSEPEAQAALSGPLPPIAPAAAAE